MSGVEHTTGVEIAVWRALRVAKAVEAAVDAGGHTGVVVGTQEQSLQHMIPRYVCSLRPRGKELFCQLVGKHTTATSKKSF